MGSGRLNELLIRLIFVTPFCIPECHLRRHSFDKRLFMMVNNGFKNYEHTRYRYMSMDGEKLKINISQLVVN